jgi:hypothetical protein
VSFKDATEILAYALLWDPRDYVCIVLVGERTVEVNYESEYIIQIMFLIKILYIASKC